MPKTSNRSSVMHLKLLPRLPTEAQIASTQNTATQGMVE